jgi:hypothetical protein
MRAPLSVFALILTLLGQSNQNELLDDDMLLENDILKTLSTHVDLNVSTQVSSQIISDHPIPAQQTTDQPITIQISTQSLQIVQTPITAQNPQIFTLPIITLPQEISNNHVSKEEDDFNGCMIVAMTRTTSAQQEQTSTNIIHVTNTVIETVKVVIPKVEKKVKVKEVIIPKMKLKKETKTKRIRETTQVISLVAVTPTLKINLQEKGDSDINVNEIWKILESKSKPKKEIKKIKKSPKVGMHKIKRVQKKKTSSDADVHEKKNKTKALEQRLKKIEAQIAEKQKQQDMNGKIIKSRAKLINAEPVKKKIKTIESDKPACKGPPPQVYKKVKYNLMKKDKKFHTLPAKKKKGSCLVEQTVTIPPSKIVAPTIVPPLVSSIAQKSGPSSSGRIKIKTDQFFYNCITNYAGTATKTVTSMTIVPVPTTHLTVKTETVFERATELLTEVLYTPYTVTTTSTDTMYMIKVTTINSAGCRNCELDSNGMVLPAGQLPPGIFATPINEVDPNKFDIVGYAGMNPRKFNPQMQGFKAQNNIRTK